MRPGGPRVPTKREPHILQATLGVSFVYLVFEGLESVRQRPSVVELRDVGQGVAEERVAKDPVLVLLQGGAQFGCDICA
jgi:hypothetical protein